MAKRFTDNEKWKKPFFKGLSTVNKLFFLYVLDECSHAGIWHVEKDIAEMRLGESIDLDSAVKELGKHVIEIDGGEKWFIPSFIEFQYGLLNDKVNAQKSVIRILQKKNLYKKYQQFMNCCSWVKDKDKDKDSIKESIKEAENLYNLYPSKCPVKKSSTGKSAKDKEKIKSLLKTHTVEKLTETISRYVQECIQTNTYMKNLSTFLNNLPDYGESYPEIFNRCDKFGRIRFNKGSQVALAIETCAYLKSPQMEEFKLWKSSQSY